jgi:hypothetical protein
MSARGMAIGPVLVFAIAAGVAAAPQRPARDVRPSAPGGPATASISGVVTAAEDGRPLGGVDIKITGSGIAREARGAFTDADGRYEISGLPAGPYTLVASKVGFMTLAYGQVRTEDVGRTVQVASTEQVDHIDFALPRGAVITLKLLDGLGEPVAGFRAVVSQPRLSGGERTLVQVISDPLMTTDDRGEIRLSGLGPGDYFVSAVSGPAISPASVPLSMRAYQGPTFYPGVASDADAQPVTVGLGDEVFVSMQLVGTRTARISGEIVAAGRPSLRLERRGIGGSTMLDATVSTDGKSFAASGLSPGEYVLTARSGKEFGTLNVQVVGEDISGLALTMEPALTLRGRFMFEGGAPKNLTTSSLVLRPVMDKARLQPIAQVKNDLTFEIHEANGTGVLRLEQSPPGWFLKAVRAQGRDITDTVLDMSTLAGKSLDVVLTQQATELRGHIVDSQGRPASSYVVVVFPEDRRLWMPQSRGIFAAHPDQTGVYTVRGLPDGQYLVAALDFLPPGDERDPKTLERLRARGTAIALQAGEPVTLDLELGP